MVRHLRLPLLAIALAACQREGGSSTVELAEERNLALAARALVGRERLWLVQVEEREQGHRHPVIDAIEAMRGVDFGVHPSHRGHGLQVELIKSAQERFPAEVALTFSTPNEISRRGALRAGRGRVGRLRHFVRPKHPARATTRAISDESPSEAGRPQVDAQSAANVLADTEDVAGLVKEVVVPSDRLTTARSLDYLRWRYGGFDGYHAVRVDSGGELAGLAVFRLAWRKAWMSSVCELLVREDCLELGNLLQKLCVFRFDLLAFQAGEALQTHVENRLRLIQAEREPRDQAFADRGFAELPVVQRGREAGAGGASG